MTTRHAEITRKTRETDIAIALDLDGRGDARVACPVGFMTHMLVTFARHGLIDLDVRASGDLEVDQHHLVEDLGIVLGQCLGQALGDRRGIRRVGNCLVPMDEALARAVVDVSGRPYLVYHVPLTEPGGTGTFQAGTVHDFWQGFVTHAGITLHLDALRGRSDHHKIEAVFKAAARALRDAVDLDPRCPDLIPSTKGTLA